MTEHQPVDWSDVERFAALYKAAHPMIRDALDADRERWNRLLWELSRIAKDGCCYEGETDEELLDLLRQRLRKRWWQWWR